MEQVVRCEKLHDEIDAADAYPVEYIVYRVTGYRSEIQHDEMLVGEAVASDLRLLIDLLSRSVSAPLDKNEKVYTRDELAKHLQISTRTIARWRKSGLRWRWMTPGEDVTPQLMFTQKAVDHFCAAESTLVERAQRFTRIPDAKRDQLIEQARSFRRENPDLSLNQAARRLADETGRAIETVRQLLGQHDREHEGDKIFTVDAGPMTVGQKRLIARARRMGVSVQKIADRFNRSASSVYRIARERRAADWRQTRIDYIANATFERLDADEVILAGPMLDASALAEGSRQPVDDLPTELHPLFSYSPMAPAHQRLLFRRYNYLKFKAARLRDQLDRYQPSAGDLDAIQFHLEQARAIRGQLARANLSVALSVARRHQVGGPDSSAHLLGLLEQGAEVLFTAIESYDLTRQESFTSYLTYHLMRRFVGDSAAPSVKGRAQVRDGGSATRRRLCDVAAKYDITL